MDICHAQHQVLFEETGEVSSHKCIRSHQQGLGEGAMLLKRIGELKEKSSLWCPPTPQNGTLRGWLLKFRCPSPEAGPATWN